MAIPGVDNYMLTYLYCILKSENARMAVTHRSTRRGKAGKDRKIRAWKTRLFIHQLFFKGRIMIAQGDKKLLWYVVSFVAIAVWGCASARLTANSVPIPVLLAGPSHKVAPQNGGMLDVEVKQSFQPSGYHQETYLKEGANKFSSAILDQTNGSDSFNVHISKMQVGAYTELTGHYKVWIHVVGDIDSAGKGGRK
jgi:hypothetical protein